MWEKPLWQKVVNTHKHRGSKLSSKLSVRDKTLFEEQHNLRDKTLSEEQHDLLYRALYPIDNCTKENLKITGRPVVDRVQNLNGKNSAIRKNHLPVAKTDFTILENGKRDNAYEKNNFFLHHCFEAFEALPKVVP